jgi:hypothetical protein
MFKLGFEKLNAHQTAAVELGAPKTGFFPIRTRKVTATGPYIIETRTGQSGALEDQTLQRNLIENEIGCDLVGQVNVRKGTGGVFRAVFKGGESLERERFGELWGFD